MNVKGILFLQQNRHAEALQHFYHGLRVIRLCLNAESKIPVNSYFLNESPSARGVLFDDCSSCLASGSSDNKKRELLFSVRLSEQTDLSSSSDDFFAIYDRALHMSLGSIPLTGVPSFYCNLLAGVLLYNLGLAHHLDALQRGDSQMLAKALDFYSMSHITLTNDCSGLMDRHVELLSLGLLAIANNVGHIHAYFRNLEETKICGGELRRRLTTLLCNNAVSDEDEEYVVFLLNMTFLSESELLCAPAA